MVLGKGFPVVFTDLDGTLLDRNTYSIGKAEEGLKLLKSKGIPIVFCTSKTFAENMHYMKKIGVKDPFVVENGGAIFIQNGYFKVDFEFQRIVEGMKVIETGTDPEKLREAVKKIKEVFDIMTFDDMTKEELMEETDLPVHLAELAKQRCYDIPFKIIKGGETEVREMIGKLGFNYTKGGRFHHITGENDKGKAVKILADLYRKDRGKVITYGLGDAENDKPMLEAVDHGYLLTGGPAEWNRKIMEWFS
jgi:mannosyl-3-phosphoglycerate phosphatase